MSYEKAMKHDRNPRKWKHTQPVLMHTNSGFWPSGSFLKEDFWPYLERCKAEKIEPMECEAYYNSKLMR